MKSQLLRISILTAMALLVIAVWKFSFGVVWDTIFLSIFVAGLISAWIVRLRMRRRIRRVLGRKATDADLASIKTWITVDERAEVAGDAQAAKAPTLPDDHMTAGVAIVGASGLSEPVSLVSHSYVSVGKHVVPAEFGPGKTPYVLMVLVPILLIWWAGPATVSRASWFHMAVAIYVILFVAAAACLHTLRLEIRPDGISYASLFCKSNTIAFSEISSAVVLTDPHYRTEAWPEFNWHDFIITPKPETGKPPIKIALLLFPSEARNQLTRVLMPEQLDTGGA
jgi:hypothetical protein